MTQLLTQAFQRASQLPDSLQDQVAEEVQQVLEEIEAEHRWDETLARSGGQLDQLGQKALDEFRSGKTKPMGFDEL
ncbi:MAG: hypothetical protein LLG00_00270 [Planctomycetaceae bacterium]|nr:hypothetical protein [Planctomycetaceae bacterium]